MTNKQVTKWYAAIRKNDKTIHRRAMSDYGRIIPFVQANLSPECTIYIRANYGKHIDNYGDNVSFINEGEYQNYKELLKAARAFQEVAREWLKEAK